ncbi:reverse transcriptase domain-containing protein [Tanacetum coccineum]
MIQKGDKRSDADATESRLIRVKHWCANLFDTESIRTDSTVQDDNNRSGNDTDADDADIRPIYDEEPMAEVGLTSTSINVQKEQSLDLSADCDIDRWQSAQPSDYLKPKVQQTRERISHKKMKSQAKSNKTSHGMEKCVKAKPNQSQVNSEKKKQRKIKSNKLLLESSNLEKLDNPPNSYDGVIVLWPQSARSTQRGYEDEIVIPKNPPQITLKSRMVSESCPKQANVLEMIKEGPHAHIRYVNKIASDDEIRSTLIRSVKLMLFPLLLSGCPHQGFSELHQLDTFYICLNSFDQDSLNSAAVFLIPCEFSGINTCNALADLGASINLMPYSVWKDLSLSELTPTCMTLELADRSITTPIGIAKDVRVLVGKFQFPADFVVVEFEPDPRVPLILGRCFLKTSRALIDVYEGEITLRVGKEAITFNLDQTSRYTANFNHMTANRIDVIDMASEEYSQEVLGFSDSVAYGNPSPCFDPIVANSSPTLTPFGESDFLLFEEANAFLALDDDTTSPEVDPTYYDPDGDILILEAFLNNEPPTPIPNQGDCSPETQEEIKLCEAKTVKSSIDEPPEVELKDLPPHLEYAFLEDDNKLPVIIAKELSLGEKADLIKVLKSHKRAIAWKLSDIQGINPEFCTHKILMEEDYKPAVQHQRRVNPKIHDVIKNEVEKLLDAGLIYPISDSPWVSPIHCVPKKGGFTVVQNEENELIPTRLVTGWRVCIDYRKLNEATRKDHFPLPFMDQMLERLAGNEYYCFLDGFSGYFQIPIDPRDQEKTTFTCPYGTFAYRRMPFGLCNAPGTFQRCMLAIFHDMVEKTMEVFMDDFSVFGNSFENCLSRLEKMLQRCEDTNLCLTWEKSHFMVKEGIVLGHKISKNGIEVDKAKIDVIAKLPHPTTVKGVRSFLGHAGFYRRFIKDFSKISRPMTHLLEKNTPFIFSNECIQAFQTLKNKLTEAPILIAPNWDLPFELMCDASDYAIGAVLGQRHEKHFLPIHYASKTMTEAESNYTTTEKEMLAVVYAFEKFRSYLIMNKSIVHTDHSALKYLFAKKDAKARLLRMVLI